jgi:ribosomal protein S27AE
MNIRTAFLQSNRNLEPIFEMDNIDNKKILQCLINSWKNIRGFSKNIDFTATNYYEETFENIYFEDIPITNEMVKEASQIFSSLKEDKEVKSYLSSYFRLLETLLIFNKPITEGCDICHSVLYYYFDEKTKRLIKKCNLCGTLFLADDNEKVQANFARSLRPANKTELKSFIN